VLLKTGLTVEVDHPVFGPIVRHGLPVALSETPGRIAPSCLRGEHTDGILAELGYTAAEIDALKGARAVFGPDEP
jgi:formyl-CoA transferase